MTALAYDQGETRRHPLPIAEVGRKDKDPSPLGLRPPEVFYPFYGYMAANIVFIEPRNVGYFGKNSAQVLKDGTGNFLSFPGIFILKSQG